MGNSITMFAGFALASQGSIDVRLFLATFLGLCCIVGSACVCNNYIDRNLDKKMQRTKTRALAVGSISEKSALLFATSLGLAGTFFLILYTNWVTVLAALFGFGFYVYVYSFLKYRTVHATLIGSIAGAMPPVVGYCAVKGSFDLGTFILFLMIVLWQMPHFFAIAIYRLEDYAAASIPVLPIKRGMYVTKVQMMFYTVAFMTVSCMLTILGVAGYSYLFAALFLGSLWCWLSFRGFKAVNDKLWARQMFSFSLIIVIALSAAIPLLRN